jgi:hypothetical protein
LIDQVVLKEDFERLAINERAKIKAKNKSSNHYNFFAKVHYANGTR